MLNAMMMIIIIIIIVIIIATYVNVYVYMYICSLWATGGLGVVPTKPKGDKQIEQLIHIMNCA